MVKIFATILATLPLVALAVPTGFSNGPMVLPREVKKIALDEVNKRFIAFDHAGREVGVYDARAMTSSLKKRADGTCTSMSNDDIEKMPGIQKLRDEADKIGTGKRKEVVNDKDFPENPANICADDAGVVIIYDGEPSCKDLKNEAGGKLEGGKITLENNEGISMSSANQVTKQSAFSVGTKIGAKFTFPLIAEVSEEISTTSTITNTQGETNTVGSDSRTLQRVEQPVDEGQDCKLNLTTKSCSIVGKGSLKMIAQGFVWFEFEDKVDGHFKWAISIEGTLPNVDDRSSAVEFKTTGNIESSGHFASEGCTKGETIVSAPKRR